MGETKDKDKNTTRGDGSFSLSRSTFNFLDLCFAFFFLTYLQIVFDRSACEHDGVEPVEVSEENSSSFAGLGFQTCGLIEEETGPREHREEVDVVHEDLVARQNQVKRGALVLCRHSLRRLKEETDTEREREKRHEDRQIHDSDKRRRRKTATRKSGLETVSL